MAAASRAWRVENHRRGGMALMAKAHGGEINGGTLALRGNIVRAVGR